MRQFGLIVLLLVSYLTPAMACMIPNLQMTAEERACCRSMHNECEQMGMSPSSRCCQKTAIQAQDYLAETKAATNHSVPVVIALPTIPNCFQPFIVGEGRIDQADYSHPHSPPGSISVLRI